MALAVGERLGAYEILGAAGSGGMGEVYKARDTRLDRIVAIKFAKARFSDRFEREARAIAALNHPHICALYDVGPDYLVMEWVEGQPLKGPLPLEETLKLGAQICDALEAAHRKGIVHRDLKPANILVTKQGVKLLDFGLARLQAAKVAAADETLTQTLTAEGTFVGTTHYMAPELFEGAEADARSDIFALGCVLYEMVTGHKAFDGKSTASVAAAILHTHPPPVRDLQPVAPPALERLIRTCLAKDPEQRWQNAGDLKRELEWMTDQVEAEMPRRPWVWIGVSAICLLAAMATAVVHFRDVRPPERTVRFQVLSFPNARWVNFKLSHGGEFMVIAPLGPARRQLAIRPLDSLEMQFLPGTEGAQYPFWSPDDRFIGFFSDRKLKKVPRGGGTVQTLCDASEGRGGTWNEDGVILFSSSHGIAGLKRVSAAGGAPALVTKPAPGETHMFPEFLPDGIHFLYVAHGNRAEAMGVYAGSLEGMPPIRLLPDISNAIFAPGRARGNPGYLLFIRDSVLLAHPFDVKQLKLAGNAFPLAQQVMLAGHGLYGAFSTSDNGVLAHIPEVIGPLRQLVWRNRSGTKIGTVGKPARIIEASLSPDEKRIALTTGDDLRPSAIWLYDLTRDAMSKFTAAGFGNVGPRWSRDGKLLAYLSFALPVTTRSELRQKPTSGAGQEETLAAVRSYAVPTSWSNDGKVIAYSQFDGTSRDVWLLPVTGDRKPVRYLQTEFEESYGQFSPDGHWMAYTSDESGELQVYVQRIPAGRERWQISTSGGFQPRWHADGRELFYVGTDGKLMAVQVKSGSTFEAGAPQPLFGPIDSPNLSQYTYDLSRDGQRFLVLEPVDDKVQGITVTLNWQAALKQ